MKRITNSLFLLSIIISFYLTIVTAMEFYFVDHLIWYNDLGSLPRNILLLSLIVLGSLLSPRLEKAKISKMFLIIALLFTISLSHVYNIQKISHAKLNSRPFIKEIDKNWVIQGDYLTIRGRGFSDTWRPGKVYISGTKVVIKYWSPNLIVIEIPVPRSYDNGYITVYDFKGSKSNQIAVKIVDPTLILTTK